MKILIGGSQQLFRAGLRSLLERFYEGGHVVEAGSFDEVMARSRDESAFDLVLVDLSLAGWPGFEGFSAMRPLLPGSRFVVVSASEAPSDVRQSLDHGAVGYISKASSAALLNGALNIIMSGGVYVPPIVFGANAVPSDQHAAEAVPSARLPLTGKQLDVLVGLRAGKSNKQIAHDLGVSEGTVKTHVTAILKRLGARNRTQAVMAAP